ncbi:conserved hypothetical protein [Talaromyces marneffei ATCC 18224]|uniref:PNPLA domain-containing protein n=1 Tax=Talaromyces marneffei (strain ATCC 18224 / CBS 334.59 / QM 7333) TaxID=441960 RepID=B6QH19_TALMQ|nr:conserved hypothetical protein [Talaromyces marneffei ATCC 18224]
MIIDDAVLGVFYGSISGSSFNNTEQLWIFPCNSTIPEFSVNFGHSQGAVMIPPPYLNFGATDYNTLQCYGSLQSNGLSPVNYVTYESSPLVTCQVKLLSLDGGGVKGITSLIILDAIMRKVNEGRGPKLHPKECFDLIGGTSTGRLIALMLFRLGMSTTEAIQMFEKIAKEVFAPKIGPLYPQILGQPGRWLANGWLRTRAIFLGSRFSKTSSMPLKS